MESRRVVKTGAETYTISIPKNWLKQNRIKKGDLLWISEDNEKLIVSKVAKEETVEVKEISFQIDNKDTGTLRRETIGAYINNYNVFVFHGKSLSKRLADIQSILANFIAVEIVEQTETKLVAKDFLNLKEFSLETTIRRMDMLARSIIIDSRDPKNLDALKQKDFEVDKLFFLTSRLVRFKLVNCREPIEALKTWWFAKNIEKIADAAKELCGVYDPKMEPFYKEVEQYYVSVMTAFFKHDKETADKLIVKRHELVEKNDKIKIEQRIFLRDIIDGSRNISKTILDF